MENLTPEEFEELRGFFEVYKKRSQKTLNHQGSTPMDTGSPKRKTPVEDETSSSDDEGCEDCDLEDGCEDIKPKVNKKMKVEKKPSKRMCPIIKSSPLRSSEKKASEERVPRSGTLFNPVRRELRKAECPIKNLKIQRGKLSDGGRMKWEDDYSVTSVTWASGGFKINDGRKPCIYKLYDEGRPGCFFVNEDSDNYFRFSL